MRNILFVLLAGFAFCSNGRAAEEAKPAEELQADLFPMPIGSFLSVEKDRVSDVAPLLKAYGFDLPEGSEATYQEPRRLLYLRSTRRDINRITRALESAGEVSDEALEREVRVTATSYGYFFEPEEVEVLRRFQPSQDGLAALPKERLRVIDRQSLVVGSGQRANVDSATREGDGGEGEGDRAEPVVKFEVEPVMSNDGRTVDLNFFYRTRRPVAEGKARDSTVATGVILATGESLVFELGYFNEPKPHLLLLEVGVDILDTKGRVDDGNRDLVRFPESYFERVK